MVRLSATACNQNCVGVVLDRPSSLFESKRVRQSCSSRWRIARKASGKIVATWSDIDHYNKGRFVKRRSLRSNPYETKVIRNGHYEEEMPWRPGAPNLSSNYSQALVRLGQLKRKSRRMRGFFSSTQKYLKDTYVRAMPVKLSRLIAMFSFSYLIMVCSIRRSKISSVSSSNVRRSSTVDRSTTSCSPDQTW